MKNLAFWIAIGLLALALGTTSFFLWKTKQEVKKYHNASAAITYDKSWSDDETATLPAGLSISEALYGTGDDTHDVTSLVRTEYQKENGLNMVVNVANLGDEDPAPGQTKVLTVRYAKAA